MEMEYRKCEILYLKLGLVEFFFAQYENSSYLRLHPKISHLCNDSPIVLQKRCKNSNASDDNSDSKGI